MEAPADNPNPVIFRAKKDTARDPATSLWINSYDDFSSTSSEEDESEREEIDSNEIYDLIRSISDPEHPTTSLEQLGVVSAEQITVTGNKVLVQFTPTVPHCGSATLIGLTLRVRLLRALPQRLKVDVMVKEGTHQSELAVNKQLNDKERVAAALENSALADVVTTCLSSAGLRGKERLDTVA
ncbi:hypothetical protein DL93DRAFT_2072235 [Clavulina sp. PMI_390]|nr:hypothetical protein DL93DRAFT_2072235 [Clavulina sp. PMI_390]